MPLTTSVGRMNLSHTCNVAHHTLVAHKSTWSVQRARCCEREGENRGVETNVQEIKSQCYPNPNISLLLLTYLM